MNEILPPAQLKARVLRAAAGAPSSTRRVEMARSATLLAVAALVSLGIYGAWGGVRISGRPPLLIVGTSMGTAVIAMLALWAAVGRDRSMVGRSRRWLLTVAIGSPLALLLWKIVWSAQFAGGLDRWPARIGLRCLELSLALGFAPLAALLFARRGTDPTHPGLSGVGFAVAIGLGVASLVDTWCPVAYVPHLLLGHVFPIAVLALLGFWTGKKVLAP